MLLLTSIQIGRGGGYCVVANFNTNGKAKGGGGGMCCC